MGIICMAEKTSIYLGRLREERHECMPRPARCPRCGSARLILWGHDSRRRRLRCGDCGRTFADSLGTPMFHARMTAFMVRQVGREVGLGTTVRQAASRLGVNRNTVQRWRSMFLSRVSEKSVTAPLSGHVVVDEMYVSLESSEARRLRGISHQKACVILGVDGSGNALARFANMGKPSGRTLESTWTGKIRHGSEVTHDGYLAYGPVLDRMGLAQGWEKSSSRLSRRAMQPVNSLCSAIRWFLRKHLGVTRTHLQSYLDWFMWLRRGNGAPTLI